MRIYIAGPMSGKPLYNFPAFDEAAASWRAMGHDVSSPPDITRALYWERFGRQYDPAADRAEWGDAITCALFQRDLAAVCACDALVVLSGWNESRGARLEIAIANALGKPIYAYTSGVRVTIDIAMTVKSAVPMELTTRVNP